MSTGEYLQVNAEHLARERATRHCDHRLAAITVHTPAEIRGLRVDMRRENKRLAGIASRTPAEIRALRDY